MSGSGISWAIKLHCVYKMTMGSGGLRLHATVNTPSAYAVSGQQGRGWHNPLAVIFGTFNLSDTAE